MCTTNQCGCRKHGLKCTGLCSCSKDCANQPSTQKSSADDDSSDDEPEVQGPMSEILLLESRNETPEFYRFNYYWDWETTSDAQKCIIINFENNKQLPSCLGYSIVKDQTIRSFERYGKCLAGKKYVWVSNTTSAVFAQKFHLKSLKWFPYNIKYFSLSCDGILYGAFFFLTQTS